MWLLYVLACALEETRESAAEPPCEPGPTPTLEIGQGELSFTELLGENDAVELVFGPQGGVHVALALRATRLDDSAPVISQITGEVEGELLADVRPYLIFRCVGPDDIQEVWGAILVFSAPMAELEDREVFLRATVTDAAGTVAEVTKWALLVNAED
ncbi:MAG TPA: hypothetical protein PKY30_13995 [Myxococcota bacterium]|nr:hypothetical protein [Myxococcota bacterium]HNH48149.1 hypothetical protein [Myxococcota bacterium]